MANKEFSADEFDELFGSGFSTAGAEWQRPVSDGRVKTTVIDPVNAADQVARTYRRYLKTLLLPHSGQIRRALHAAIEEEPNLTKGPYIQLVSPFSKGRAPSELIAEGELCRDFTRLSQHLPVDRPLYLHQEEALRKANSDRNLIVSTGTGSGKTECFLIPTINDLLREQSNGSLGAGVRTLLLYPMNALANDQIKRLRELLRDVPEITFGRYTGETKESETEALTAYREQFGTEPLPNELISRVAMRENPPHILLTNYAMLEYLLLRPVDTSFFDGVKAGHWKRIVVDEAHVYAGAQGSEVALLLRRLKDRVSPSQDLQYIATSASLQGTETEITRFGEELFGGVFEWESHDLSRQDIIYAKRKAPSGNYTWEFSEDELSSTATIQQRLNSERTRFGRALVEESHIVRLRKKLAGGSLPVDSVVKTLWPETNLAESRRWLANLITAGNAELSDGVPVLSARYHMFARATEGAFVDLALDQDPKVFLNRRVKSDDGERHVYELGACKRCGGMHLLGLRDNDNFIPPLEAKEHTEFTWIALTSANQNSLIDEDDESERRQLAETHSYGKSAEQLDSQNTPARLCITCGKLENRGGEACRNSHCNRSRLVDVMLYEHETVQQGQCALCGHQDRDVVKRLITDVNAAPAVLATSLYDVLPSGTLSNSGAKQSKKLLAFSDSRQAAAFAAPYLEQSHHELLKRRLIFEVLQQYALDCSLSVSSATHYLKILGEKHEIFRTNDAFSKKKAASTWLFSELVTTAVRNSLNGMGLMSVQVDASRLQQLAIYQTLVKYLGSENDASALLNILAQEFRRRFALTHTDEVDTASQDFLPRRYEYHFQCNVAKASPGQLSWIPSTNRTNNRLAFVEKLLLAKGAGAQAKDNAKTLLERVWDSFDEAGLLKNSTQSGRNRQWDSSTLILQNGHAATWYCCTVCQQCTEFNCLGLCPNGACAGTLEPYTPFSEENSFHHYAWLAQNLGLHSLIAEEHTAQWSPEEASRVQQKFLNGDINVLSCSTTFELGVDVGELQSVLLRNVPPKTANYVQRAGRAGRRLGSAAFVLTFARRAAHDLSMFRAPEQMIDGVMQTPYLNVDNLRIAQRHCYSVVFAEFLRKYAFQWEFWKKSGWLFPSETSNDQPVKLLSDFVAELPQSVHEALERIMPNTVYKELNLDEPEWLQEYVSLFQRVHEDLNADITTIEKLRDEKAASKDFQAAARLERTIKTLREQPTLGYLGAQNLLPKYGFPVDTVEMSTMYGSKFNSVRLARDLVLAISEYAPGNSVVAGGKTWESAGLRIVPGRALPTRFLVSCNNCQRSFLRYEHSPFNCDDCGEEITARGLQTINPMFGFVAAREPKTVTTIPPKNRYIREDFITDFGEEAFSPVTYGEGHRRLSVEARRRATVTVMNSGSEYRGFFTCQSCGWASERRTSRHVNPRTNRDCYGDLELFRLEHSYQTDIAFVTLPRETSYGSGALRSAMFALLESSSVVLGINRDDLNATLVSGFYAKLVIFDAVPGGAGFTKKILDQFPEILAAALRRVADCECGEDTSCYSCLRSYNNQRVHHELKRKDAVIVLEELSGLLRSVPR